jgi:DNA-directed RNA polymerase specialized sigma24 family protein
MADENTTYINYLIDISKAGRQRGFLELCEINLRNVFTVVYRLLDNLDAAKRITAKAFLKSWSEIKEIPKNKPFQLWIKGIAIILAMEELENAKLTSNQKSEAPSNINSTEYLEFLIKQLPVIERTIFVLHDLEGYSYREIQYFFPNLIEDELKTILIQTRQLLIMKLGL